MINLINFFNFSGSPARGNMFNSITITTSNRGAKMILHNNNRFIKYMRDKEVVSYRCSKYSSQCRVKIKVDEKQKYAVKTGKHNHKPDPKPTAITKTGAVEFNRSFQEPTESPFNKNVTNDVKLITDHRGLTKMILHGYAFTTYYKNGLQTR